MDGFLIDNSLASAFNGITSAHNGLARHLSDVASKLELQIQKLSLHHEQVQAQASAQQGQTQAQASSQELRVAQLAQDLEAARSSLQMRIASEMRGLGEKFAADQQRFAEQLAGKQASKDAEVSALIASLQAGLAEMGASQSKLTDQVLPQVQTAWESRAQSIKSDLTVAQEQAESRARAQDLRTEQQQLTLAAMEGSFSSRIKGIQVQLTELAQKLDAAEGRATNQTAATEKKFVDLSAHMDQLEHASRTQALPKLKMDIETGIHALQENVKAQQQQFEHRLHSLGVESTREFADMKCEWKSGQDMLQKQLAIAEAYATHQVARLDKAQSALQQRLNVDLDSLHSKVSKETRQLLASSLEDMNSRAAAEMQELRKSITMLGTDGEDSMSKLRGIQDQMISQFDSQVSTIEVMEKKISESGAQFETEVHANQERHSNLWKEMRKRSDELSNNLKESDLLAAGRMYQLQSILYHFKKHLKEVEDRLHGTGVDDCDSAWMSFRPRTSPSSSAKSEYGRPSRPSSAKSEYGRPMHTFQSYHRKVREAVSTAEQQLRGCSAQASSSEERCDAGFGALGALLRDLRAEAPTAAASGAMEDAISLRGMDILMEGLSNSMSGLTAEAPVPVGTALAAARAVHE